MSSKQRVLADKISWPSPDYGDAIFKKAIHDLKETCKPKPNNDWWRQPHFDEILSPQELFPVPNINPNDPEFQNQLISSIYDQIQRLENEYKTRCKSTGLSFDHKKSLLIYGNITSNVTPDTNQYYLCKYLFEKYPNGEYVDYSEIIEYSFGRDPDDSDPDTVYTAATEINKRTRMDFGFSILSTRRHMVAIICSPETPQN